MKKFWINAQDKMSCLTHFIGALFGVAYLVVLQVIAHSHQKNLLTHIGLLVFALSTIALYSASSFYHYIDDNASNKEKFRKLDHAMIYILIVGSYTPVCMTFFQGSSRYIFPIVIWSIAIFGVIAKIFWINMPRILSTLLYLVLGWSILFDFNSLMALPSSITFWLILGGVSYSIGAIIYMIKKPNLSAEWGFHELFHIFILLGTFFHFIGYALTIA
ncbi:MAG: PAQR family membrane homeostasis protein TrhA [Anaerorhabdus sp.]